MRFAWLALSAGLLPFTGAAQEQDDPLRKHLSAMEAVIASESPLFGVDTRMRVAALLVRRHPALAHQWVDRALEALPGLSHPPTVDEFRAGLVAILVDLDLEEAQRVARSTRRWADRDAPAKAWEPIIRSDKSSALAFATEALRAGAYRVSSIPNLLEKLAASDEPSARALYSQVVASFPESAVPEDSEFLRRCMKIMAGRDDPATAEAVRKLDAADRALKARAGAESQKTKPTEKTTAPEPDLSALPFSAALERIRVLPPDEAVPLYIDLSRRKEASAAQAAVVGAEALAISPRVKDTDTRLVAQAMLTRDAVLRGDDTLASSGARLLSESFDFVCRCETSACDSLEGREECASMIETFAEYLDEHQIAPETLRLYHPSLKARLLLLELKRLLS